MRVLLIVLMVCSVAASARQPHRKATPAKVKSAAAPVRKPMPTIPADATRVDENTFVHTDAKGDTWVYRRTPFGVTKEQQTAMPAAVSAPATDRPLAPFTDSTNPAPGRVSEEEVTAVENGEVVRFERSTPFGKQAWTRKVTELNDNERALLDRIRQRSAQKLDK